MDEQRAGSIGPDELADAARRRRQGLLAAGGGTVVAVLGFAGGLSGLPAAPAAVLITGGLLGAAFGVAAAVHQSQVVAIGSRSPWHLEHAEVRTVGAGKRSKVVVQLASCRWAHGPWGAASNSSTLVGHQQLEVAGDPGGRILVRIPGDRKVRIYRPTG